MTYGTTWEAILLARGVKWMGSGQFVWIVYELVL